MRTGTLHAQVVSWSGGKDAAYALLHGGDSPTTALLTTYDEATGCLPHTDVSLEVARRQAAALGLPMLTVAIPSPWSEQEYAVRMSRALAAVAPGGRMLFGDLHLESLRADREARLARSGRVAVFPGWTSATAIRAREIVDAGIRAVVVSVDLRALPVDFLGRAFDAGLVADLPAGVDPCGEGGEFQTFVLDHPRFAWPVRVETGRVRVDGDHATLALAPAAG